MLHRPILTLTIAPADSADLEHFRAMLSAFSEADPVLAVEVDPASSIITVGGESLEQLKTLCRRVEEDGHIPLAFASLEVNRLETIRRSAEAEGKYIRQTGGIGNYAHVKLRLEPSEQGQGIEFSDEIRDGVIPPLFIQPIEAGILEAAHAGILAGHQMVDLRVTLYGGSFHETDSNEAAFRIAAQQTFRSAARKALPIVLEPVMNVVFTVPESKLTATKDEIRARRGRVATTSIVGKVVVISAEIPLAEMPGGGGLKPTAMFFDSFQPVSSDRDDAEPAGFAVRNPKDPKPMTGTTAADLDSDWT